MNLQEELKREKKLEAYMRIRKAELPDGALSVSGREYNTYYYQVISEKGHRETIYLNPDIDDERKIILGLMEKRNIVHGHPLLEKNIKTMNTLKDELKEYDPLATRYGYLLGSEHYLDDEVCAKDWKKEGYIRNPFKPEQLKFETKSGLLVRSKSEMIIADVLYEYEIPFKPEVPLKLKGRTIYPDFQLLHEQLRRLFWWEHYGRLDLSGYNFSNYSKINECAECGIYVGVNMIITFEDNEHPLTRGTVIEQLRKHRFID